MNDLSSDKLLEISSFENIPKGAYVPEQWPNSFNKNRQDPFIKRDLFTLGKLNVIDVLIIGAGPIGLATALWFGKHNYNILMIEQYSEFKTTSNLEVQPSRTHSIIKDHKRSFNERRQQVGLDIDSMNFFKDLDIIVWGQIKRKGFTDSDWVNIPIYTLQNILMKEVLNFNNIKILFDTKIESVTCFNSRSNCRVLMVNDDVIYGVLPRLVVIADGKHDDKGTAKQFFNFASACKVHLSTYGIVGMIVRNINNDEGSIFLKNYSSDSYISKSHEELGNMYIRLLGSMKERYIALGLCGRRPRLDSSSSKRIEGSSSKHNAGGRKEDSSTRVHACDTNIADNFLNLTESQIRSLLVEAYNSRRDKRMGEPEIKESDFFECSKAPIPIILDYRKETIKLLEGSTTIVSIEGDAARKTTFFSGSGLNSGYKALIKLFKFCDENAGLIFDNSGNSDDLLLIDQKLLEKDQECVHISLELLIKGISYIGNRDESPEIDANSKNDPIIHSIIPAEGEVPWFIYINGSNLLISDGKPPVCIFEWNGGASSTHDVIVYSNNLVGVKIPRNAKGKITISLRRSDDEIVISPTQFNAIIVSEKPEIMDVREEDKWIYINGKNFKSQSYVMIGKEKIKAYCNSINSLICALPHKISGNVTFCVHTQNGVSNFLTKKF
ncbi:Hypothetical protein HVR_LOCUS725 [uncultured virus]|nr:Hypothetical protein HVR_LOCUS725 [uncultured virus]